MTAELQEEPINAIINKMIKIVEKQKNQSIIRLILFFVFF